MNREKYVPEPIDTSLVVLPDDIIRLAEMLAKNTHDTWAAQRIKEGWEYGKSRNDDKKTNPCLVPFEELSDSEKSYDYNTALETLKVIVKLGYKIEK